MQIRFGTDGWRGLIARDFTFDNLALVAQATMDYLHLEGLADRGIVIGYDRRFLSREFAGKVAEVAAGNGIRVLLTDTPAPTPAVSWAVREQGAGGGIMITASHNPPQYNGFKVKEAFGGSARPSTTAILEEIVSGNLGSGRAVLELPLSDACDSGMVRYFDPREGYFRQLARYVDLDLIRSAGIAAVADPMFGSGSGYLSELVPGLTEINAAENPGFLGRPPEPTVENLREVAALVRSGVYQVGLALDGDADRIGAVDETGEFFSSHCIFTLILRHLLERKGLRGGVVKTVSTTRMIDLLCERFDLPLFETPIGFKHICELMLGEDILIGGEESGGLGVKGHIPERDGILMALLLLEIMAMNGKGLRKILDETMDEIGHFYYRRIDVPIDNEAKERLLVRLKTEKFATIARHPVAGENFLDGFKYLLADGSWLLIRPSGTEPVLRLYSESGDPALVEAFLAAGREMAGIT